MTPEPSDAGITLVEVLVAMVISLTVASMTLLFLLSAVRSTRRADGQSEQAATARSVIDAWTGLVPLAVDPAGESAPGAVRFLSISAQSVRFCLAFRTKSTVVGQPDLAPGGVELSLVGGKLIEKRWTSCSRITLYAADSTHVVAPRVSQVTPSTWLFTPLARSDLPSSAVSAGLLTSTLTGGGSLVSTDPAGAAQIALVAGVQLAFTTLADPTRPAPSATYSTFLALQPGG